MNKKLRVLIADDNRHFCSILKETVDRDPALTIVGIANDGSTALDMIKDIRPDIVILDIIMPMLDGLGVLEKSRASGVFETTRFIVMSAVGHDDITFRAMNLGASYYIAKPFDLNEFLRRLKEFSVDAEEVPKDTSPAVSRYPRKMETYIIGTLRELGVPMHVKGYRYLQDAVSIVLDNPSSIGRVTKTIYPVIAERHETTSSRVERAIRNAIDITFIRGNQDAVEKLFSMEDPDGRKITNSEFIIAVADRIRGENLR